MSGRVNAGGLHDCCRDCCLQWLSRPANFERYTLNALPLEPLQEELMQALLKPDVRLYLREVGIDITNAEFIFDVTLQIL